MALTDEDFARIEASMETTLDRVVERVVERVIDEKRLATKDDVQLAVKGLATKKDLDRMESRMLVTVGLLERDGFDRIDDHERRIRKLEQARAK